MFEKDILKKIMKEKPLMTKGVEESHQNFDSSELKETKEERETRTIIDGYSTALEKSASTLDGEYETSIYNQIVIEALAGNKDLDGIITAAKFDDKYGEVIKQLLGATEHHDRLFKNNKNNGNDFMISKTQERIERYEKKLQESGSATIKHIPEQIRHFFETKRKLEIYDPKDPSLN